MSTHNLSPLPSVGFLTVVDDGSGCLLGGYLVVNSSGRPLEFQCTAPVKANRAQEILYGPTLKPYLWGEQIGGALISKSRSRPLFVCTNQLDTFAVRTAVEVPVLQITQHEMTQPGAVGPDRDHQGIHPAQEQLTLGPYAGRISRSHPRDRRAIEAAWKAHLVDLNLSEPFTRIREAISEAQRAARGPASRTAA